MKRNSLGTELALVFVVVLMIAAAFLLGMNVQGNPPKTQTQIPFNLASTNSRHAPVSETGLMALKASELHGHDAGLAANYPMLSGAIVDGKPVVIGLKLGPSQATTQYPSSSTTFPQLRTDPPVRPAHAVRFVNDTSYITQDETSVGAFRFGPLAKNVYVMGSFNDFRAFFCPGSGSPFIVTCQTPYTGSLTGWTLSQDNGAHVLKGGLVPGPFTANTVVNETNNNGTSTSVGWRQWSWGDPATVPYCTGPLGANCGFYQVSLALNPFFGTNGIELATLSPSLVSTTPVDCTTYDFADPTDFFGPQVNPCFAKTFVFGNTTVGFDYLLNSSSPPTTFEDKPSAAVDGNPASPNFGNIFIGWDHFNADGTSSAYLAMCTPTLVCTMYSGGGQPAASGPDPYVAWTTPAVDSAGNVFLSWCNYGTAISFGPIECRERAVTGPGTYDPTHTMFSFMGIAFDVSPAQQLPGAYAIPGFSTEQFRTANIQTFAADTSGASGLANNLYFAIPVCEGGSFYAIDDPTVSPGNCGYSGIVFARSTDHGASWSAPKILSKPAVNIQPTLAVDKVSGKVRVLWYTAAHDPFNHKLDVDQAKSINGGSTFTFNRVTSSSTEPDADPLMFAYPNQFGGSWAVPQFGDYIGAYATGGKVYVLFTGNYKAIVTPEGTTTQADPWLIVGA